MSALHRVVPVTKKNCAGATPGCHASSYHSQGTIARYAMLSPLLLLLGIGTALLSCLAAGGSPPVPVPELRTEVSAARNVSVEQLYHLAEAYRGLGTPEGVRRALPYTWAAAQLAPFAPVVSRSTSHNAALLFSLLAHSTAREVHGHRSADLLARLLGDAAVSRAHSRVAVSLATRLVDQVATLRWTDASSWTRMQAALVAREPQCSRQTILLDGGSEADDPCAGSPLAGAFRELVIIALPSRFAHADAFVRSLGCRRYTRVDAVTAPVPSERGEPATVFVGALTAGVTRLYVAYVSCVLPYVAAQPAGARVGIFEDDVALVDSAELPRIAAGMKRLLAVGGSDAAALHFFGTCFDTGCFNKERILSEDGDDALVRLTESFRCTHAFAATPSGATKALHLLGAQANATPVVDDAIDARLSALAQQGLLDVFAFVPSLLVQKPTSYDALNPGNSAHKHVCDELLLRGAWNPPPKPPAPIYRAPTDPLLVTPNLFAGLGNQLSMLAAACGFAEAMGAGAQCGLYSHGIAPSPHSKGGSYASTVFRGFAVTDAMPDALYNEPVFAANLHLPPPTWLPVGSTHLHISGYFQHEAYVPPSFASRIWLPPSQSRANTAFVHARRGDYVGNRRHDVGLTGEAGGYFDRAMALLRERHAPGLRFLVFSDDVAWARSQAAFSGRDDVHFYEPPPGGEDDELHALAAMTACEAGGVASNSSFSWWAAFLNRHANKTVAFPDSWYGDGDSLVDDTPFHGSFLVPASGSGEITRVDRDGAPWRALGL